MHTNLISLLLALRRFEALLQTGKSPTCELLFDWGTTNCTVGDLVDILVQNEFFAPASLLLPGKLSMSTISVTRMERQVTEIGMFLLLLFSQSRLTLPLRFFILSTLPNSLTSTPDAADLLLRKS